MRIVAFIITIISLIFFHGTATANPVKPVSKNVENIWKNRSLKVNETTWKNRKKIPEFIQDRFRKIIFKKTGKFGWMFYKDGVYPFILTSFLERNDENYSFSMKIKNSSGKEIISIKGNCDACTVKEAEESLLTLREDLIEKLEKKFVEEKQKFNNILNSKKVKNVKKKIVKKKSVKPPKIKLIVKLAKPKIIDLPEYERPPAPKKLWMYTLSGVALTSLITGVYLLAIDNDINCDTISQNCRERYATAGAGWSFIGGGLIASGLVGYLYYNIKQKEVIPKVVISPGISGTTKSINLSFRF